MSFETLRILGSKLSQEINKSVLICSGILHLALRDVKLDYKFLNVNLWLYIIENSLPKRLESLKIVNVEKIIENMKQYVFENQSLFTLAI